MTQLRVALWLAVSTERQTREDKISLKEQERVGREWVASLPDARIVKMFYWDGYSRSETDVLTAYEDFANQGRYEYHELRKMWQNKEFDVLWVYVHDRIARSTALYAQVMGNVIRSGAKIYSHSDGWIDEHNVETFMAIGGFSAAGDVRKLVKRREMGMRKRLQDGKSTTSGVPMTHKRVRDSVKGDELGLVVDESKRRLFQDAATLVLEGVGWSHIEIELYKRYGHVTAAGKPYAATRIYNMMVQPATWGNNAMRYRSSKKGVAWASVGEWIFEPGHPIPAGVEIAYGVLPPVYEPELAAQLQAEIKYRMGSVRGNAAGKAKMWYSSLLVCDECGYYMAVHWSGAPGYRKPTSKCLTHWRQTHSRADCDQRKSVSEVHLRAWFSARLQEVIDGLPSELLDDDQPVKVIANPEIMRVDIEKARAEIGAMIRRQSKAETDNDIELYNLIENEIQKARALLTVQLNNLAEIENHFLHSQQDRREIRIAVEHAAEMGIDSFWQQTPHEIRKFFLLLLGNRRISVRDGKIHKRVIAPSVNGR